MKRAVAQVVIVGALLAGCANPTPEPPATPAAHQVAVEPTPTPPPTSTAVPSATPTISPANEGCVRATTEIPEGQNPTRFVTSGPAGGCYDTVGDFLDDIGLTWGEFVPGMVVTFWTQWPVDERGAVVYATPTPLPSPTPTSVPQTLGRIFPEGYDSPGVWSNTNTGLDIVAMGFDIHFDVGLPLNLVTGQDPILSPASGRITKVYSVPHDQREGQVVEIEPDPPLAGVEAMISSAGLDPPEVQAIVFILGHIIPLRTEGWVEAGEPVGIAFDAWFEPDVVAYVIIARLRDGREFQFSPCSLPNTASFCGKCYPGTPYNCP